MEYDPRERWTLRELYRMINQHLVHHPIRRERLGALQSKVDTDYALDIPYVVRRMADEEDEEEEEE